ncbi:MAG: hypothetical protein M3072_12800 [Candidatus Dormibacteraeota bacterium]|nr:hypothetical protein [Candidatus Dormibacteraeota bacterium]
MNQSRKSDGEALQLVQALQTQVTRDLQPSWGVAAQVHFLGSEAEVPRHWWRLFLLDQRPAGEPRGEFGHHTLEKVDGLWLPVGYIYTVPAAAAWTRTASHELLEMLCNPYLCAASYQHKQHQELQLYSLEACDPCQTGAYTIAGVEVSNFVYPAFFSEYRPKPLDHLERLEKRYFPLLGGIVSVYDPAQSAWVGRTPDPADPSQLKSLPALQRDRFQSNGMTMFRTVGSEILPGPSQSSA